MLTAAMPAKMGRDILQKSDKILELFLWRSISVVECTVLRLTNLYSRLSNHKDLLIIR